MLHINLNGIMNVATCKQYFDQPFQGMVLFAYQIKGNDACSNMVRRPGWIGGRGRGKNSIIS